MEQDLRRRAGRTAPPVVDEPALRASLDRLFPGASYDEQRVAAETAVRQWTTVLTGGPGTGKTTTVAGLLAVLAEQAELAGGRRLRIALTAPTGKAAARLEEAVRDEMAHRLAAADTERLGDLRAVTLHRLLGTRFDSAVRFRHDRDNRLPHDIVVVDETSMVSLTMMARLLEALRPGDPAGAGRRPRSAGLHRGRCGAGRPGRRPGRRGPRRGRGAAHLPPVRHRDRRAGAGGPRGPARRHPGTAARGRRAGGVRRAGRPARRAAAGAAPRRAGDPRGRRARRRGRRPGGPDPAPAAVRAPRRTPRRRLLEPHRRALDHRGDRGPAVGHLVRRPAGAGDRQRLRPRHLQR